MGYVYGWGGVGGGGGGSGIITKCGMEFRRIKKL